MRKFLKNWWNGLKYEPGDPRFLTGGVIKIAAIGGGTGLFSVLRGLKNYSHDISAIVTVTDSGGLSTSVLRKEFDIVAPGDVRKCISALAEDEEMFSKLFEYRFKGGNGFAGHTLGNIWLTALTEYFDSFEKAVLATSQIFKTAGQVIPSTLEKVDLKIKYEDGTTLIGEANLDEVVKKIKKVTLTNPQTKAYHRAVKVIQEADLIIVGPGSLYASIIPNLLLEEIAKAIENNKKAIKVYIANCSTERTQTANYSIEDHIKALFNHSREGLFDYCLVNNHIVKTSQKQVEFGEINNITTDEDIILGVKIVRADVINEENPLYHDSIKLSKALMTIYDESKQKNLEKKKEVALENVKG